MTGQTYSDSTQLASIRAAISAVDKDRSLGPAEREYHKRVLECIGDRIEDHMRRSRQAESMRRGERRS
jgi:hypothetical protein